MKHSRKRVMKEHYELYMRKHIFNGRYFQRNMQVVMCVVLVVALTIGCVAIGTSTDSGKQTDQKVSVMDALFGGNESSEKSAKRDTVDEKKEVTDIIDTENLQETTDTTEAMTEELAIYAMAETSAEETTEEAEPSLFDDRCIANVEDKLNIRQEPDAEAEFVGYMESGAIAIVEGTEGDWTKIKSGDVEGYVLTQFILTGSVAEAFAKDYVILQGKILEDGVNIRSEKSTTSDILTILDKDAVVTVLEDPTAEEEETSPHVAEETVAEETVAEETVAEKTSSETETENQTKEDNEQPDTEDDILWMTVRLEDGQEGYVSADYVNVEELYQIAVSKEELDRIAAEEAARQAAEEEAARQAAAAAAASTQKSGGSSSSGGNTSYQGASITPITATQAGDCIGTFTITGYCGCAKCSGGNNLTATGTVPAQGRTIAADPSVLPYGTQVVIGGVVYTVEDCGSGVRGNHIDIFFATHDQALAFGRRSMQVFKY